MSIKQLKKDKSAGFAWSEGHFEAGIGSCAAVVFDHSGRVAGALNVSGPQTEFADENTATDGKIRTAVLDAARQASTELGFSGR